MWDQETRNRFRSLRQRGQEGLLTGEERGELDRLTAEIEAREQALLGPATERLQREAGSVEEQNHALEALAKRREKLSARLEQVLREARAEREAINQELARIFARSRP
jgi:hypothetical protein